MDVWPAFSWHRYLYLVVLKILSPIKLCLIPPEHVNSDRFCTILERQAPDQGTFSHLRASQVVLECENLNFLSFIW